MIVQVNGLHFLIKEDEIFKKFKTIIGIKLEIILKF